MVHAIPLLLSLLAADQALPEREEWAAYEECRSARRSTKEWVVSVADAWLRAEATPESPVKGILHRGQSLTLLKKASAGNLLVKTEEGKKGWIWSDEAVERVIPPRDSRPVDQCPEPAAFRKFRNGLLPMPSPMAPPGPTSEELEALEVEETPSEREEDTGANTLGHR